MSKMHTTRTKQVTLLFQKETKWSVTRCSNISHIPLFLSSIFCLCVLWCLSFATSTSLPHHPPPFSVASVSSPLFPTFLLRPFSSAMKSFLTHSHESVETWLALTLLEWENGESMGKGRERLFWCQALWCSVWWTGGRGDYMDNSWLI